MIEGVPDVARSAARSASSPERWRPVATIALFALLGPLIGYGLVLLMLIFGMPDAPPAPNGAPERPFFDVWFGLHPMLLLFVYLLGGLPALFTGLLVVAADRLSPGPLRRMTVAVVTGAATTALYLFLLSRPVEGVPGNSGTFATLVPLGAAAAFICAHLSRRWRYNTPLTPPPNTATNEA